MKLPIEPNIVTILDSAPVGIAFSTKDKIQFANPKFVEMFGFRPGDASLSLYVNQADWLAVSEQLENGKPLFNREMKMYDLDRRIRDIMVTYLPITFDGEAGVLGWLTDITERKQTEEKLRISEERFSLATHAAGIGVWDWYLESGVTLWDDVMFDLYGLPKQVPMPYSQWEQSVHPDDLEQARASLQRVMQHGGNDTVEFRILTPDGKIHHIYAAEAAMTDSTGRPVRIIGINMDITERKVAERALRESKERLEAAASAGIVGIWEWDVAQNRLVWDKVMCRLYGICEQEFGGTYDAWFSTIHPDDKAYVESELQAARHGEREFAPEFRVIWANGSVRHIKAASHTTFDEQGRLLRMIGVNYDLTEQKLVEAALISARAEAEAANKAKSQFLANMSHELRTPMNAILGFSQIMARSPGRSPQDRENLGIILKSGDHLLNLINNVLDLAKIEAGKIQFEPQDFDLGDLINEVISLLQVRAEAKGLQLTFDQSSSFPGFVKTDPGKLRQILINIAGNSIKFTERGGVSIKAALCQTEANDDKLRLQFEVTDTGPGIPAEDLEKIFKPFEQATAKSATPGTGLGLTISREFINLMGGSIVVDSMVGKGTTFRFTIRAERAAADHLPQLYPARTSIESIEGADRCKILIVEDQLENRMLMRRLLEPFGFPIREAENGRQGVDIAIEWEPDLILMDRRMPVMDGVDATREIRALKRPKPPVIIAVTAQAYAQERNEFLDAGCDAFLSKPFKDTGLFALIGKLLPVKIIRSAPAPLEAEAGKATDLAESLRAVPAEKIQKLIELARQCDQEALWAELAPFPEVKAALQSFIDGYRFDLVAEKLQAAMLKD